MRLPIPGSFFKEEIRLQALNDREKRAGDLQAYPVSCLGPEKRTGI